jgi:DTW domain-containing protein YfiP
MPIFPFTRQAKACICGKLEPLVMPLDFIIYMHTKEYRRASNTGRLIPMSHPSSVVLISGNLQDEARLKEIYEKDADNVVMLFPSADSVTVEELMQEREAKGLTGRLRVILPDGTWRQARSCVRRYAGNGLAVRLSGDCVLAGVFVSED